MNVIITMAGNGRRFREAGFNCPKYEIEAHGRTLFEWSMRSLDAFWRRGASGIFISQREHAAPAFIDRVATRCGLSSAKVLEIDGVTNGQATTALMAGQLIDQPELPVVIFNIDTYVDPRALNPDDVHGSGWIPCFPGAGDAWSFAQTEDDSDRVVQVREKVRISDWATVGLYHFSSFELYQRTYAQHFADSTGEEKGERYIAPMYNTLIRQPDSQGVFISRVPLEAVIPMGTPAELSRFLEAAPPV